MPTFPARSAIVATLVVLGNLVALGSLGAPPALASDSGAVSAPPAINSVNFGDDQIIVPGVKPGFGATARKSSNARTRGTTVSDASTPLVEKVWVSAAAVTAQSTDDVNTGTSDATARTLISQLDAFWSAQSDGAVSVVFGGFETRSLGDASCTPTTVLSQEESAAFAGSFDRDAWIGTHDHLLVLTREACGNQSFATVGGNGGLIFSGNGLSTSLGMPALLHEFGHNLGFRHADASICTNSTSYDADIASFGFASTTCPTREYDDFLDIMGYTVNDATPNLSSVQRILAGWLTDYATATDATTTQTVVLSALGGSTGTRALRIVDPISGSTYYVEYRAPAGRDATSAEFRFSRRCDTPVSGYSICELDGDQTNGVVRVLRELPFADQGASGTTVLATGLLSGATDATERHTHLNVGQVFSNFDGGFSVTVNSVSLSEGASVTVSFVRPDSTTTSLAIDGPASQTYASPTPVVANVTVTSAGGGTPTGSLSFYDGKTMIATRPVDATGAASAPLPATLGVGAHSITARFTPASSDLAASVSTATTVTVRKATSAIATRLRSTTVRRGGNEIVAVTVTVPGVSAPTGTLTVYANGRKMKSYSLTTSEHGRRSLTMPQFGSPGRKSIVVVYSGNSRIVSARSAAMRATAR